MKTLIPGVGYTDDELALPDHFFDPYVGRVYEWGSTEVFSMGLERFESAESMVNFLADDEEHFALVLGALRP